MPTGITRRRTTAPNGTPPPKMAARRFWGCISSLVGSSGEWFNPPRPLTMIGVDLPFLSASNELTLCKPFADKTLVVRAAAVIRVLSVPGPMLFM